MADSAAMEKNVDLDRKMAVRRKEYPRDGVLRLLTIGNLCAALLFFESNIERKNE